jgi:hypothetical protein
MNGIDLDLLLEADDDVGMLLLEAAIRYMLKFTEHVCACHYYLSYPSVFPVVFRVSLLFFLSLIYWKN